MNPIWIFIGGAVIVALVAVAVYLHWRLHKVRKRIKEVEREQAELMEASRDKINKSIQILCRSLIEDQVGCAEVSIRVSYLLNQLSVDGARRAPYVAFDKMASAVNHIPILDQWRALPKRKKREYELQIAQHEQELGDFVRDAAQQMLGERF